jgi:anti-anti-sigma factor
MTDDRIQISQEKNVQIMKLSLPEQVDGMEIDQIINSLLGELEGHAKQPWVMDLSDVTYMGSAMLGLMVNVRQRIGAAGGKLVLCNMSQGLLRIFQTCCLERLFKIAKTRDEALGLAQTA